MRRLIRPVTENETRVNRPWLADSIPRRVEKSFPPSFRFLRFIERAPDWVGAHKYQAGLPVPMNHSPTITPRIIGWSVFAAIGGICSFVLPAYLAGGGATQPPYGWPLIPWFAIAAANRQIFLSMISYFLLGVILGITPSRRWYILPGVAMGAPLLLHGVNVVHDWTRDSTSHNLFPVEILFYGLIALPVFVGAALGFTSLRFLRKRKAA